MNLKQLYDNFIYGLLHGTVVIRISLTKGSVYGSIYEAKKGKVSSRICSLHCINSSKGKYVQFIFNGKTLENIWEFDKAELDFSELVRIDIDNMFFEKYYEP